jgi:Tol biopolymer transport system component
MKKFDRIVLIVLAILLALILIVLEWGDRTGVQVTLVMPREGNAAGIYGPIGLQFDQPMDQASAEAHFTLSPEMPGYFKWDGDILWFTPDTPFDPKLDYQVSLGAGALATSGRELQTEQSWTPNIQPPDILYLVLAGRGGDLWRWDSATEAGTALTNTGGAVIDFAPNRTGERIITAVQNEAGGSDLWVMPREGAAPTLLLDCGSDFCDEPAWSHDDAWVLYSRQVRNPNTQQLQNYQVWSLNMLTHETAPFLESGDIYGHSPSFSPDGSKVAFYHTTQSGIQVFDLDTGENFLLPTSAGTMGDWSPDGQSMLFTDLIPSALEPEVGLYIANLEERVVQRALAGESDGTSFGQPRYSPDGSQIAVNLRPVNATSTHALWVLDLDGEAINLIANQQAVTYTSYHWRPSGYELIYQSLNTSNLQSAIWLWDGDTDQSHLLIENGARPVWLP